MVRWTSSPGRCTPPWEDDIHTWWRYSTGDQIDIFCKYFPPQSRCEDCGLPLRVLVTGGWLGVSGGRYAVSEVWTGRSWGELGPGAEIEATVPPMGVTLLR